jgi:hypothetical protein
MMPDLLLRLLVGAWLQAFWPVQDLLSRLRECDQAPHGLGRIGGTIRVEDPEANRTQKAPAQSD